jgi:hypothetical protein
MAARLSFWKPPGCEASRERLLHSALTRSKIAAGGAGGRKIKQLSSNYSKPSREFNLDVE